MLDKQAKVGFIGLGAMGEPMSASLMRAGFSVTSAAHKDRAPLERLAQAGLHEASDPAAVASQCQVVITCVPDAPQVREVFGGERGLLSTAKAGTYFIDMSTISPMASKEIAQLCEDRGAHFLDAPVSGGPARAAEGTLAIMVGGKEDHFAAVEPVLRAMGNPTHVGDVGTGEVVKLVNQIIIANTMLGNLEGLCFAKRAGADLEKVRKVIAGATGSNYLLENWLPKTFFAGTFDGGFALDLLRKDLGAALAAAREMLLPMPATAASYQMYTAQSAEGDGRRDYSVVSKFYERNSGEGNARHVLQPG